MKRLLIAAAATLLSGAVAGGAIAQTPPPANPSAKTPAISTSNTTNPGAPAPGANSFTESQAKSRIAAAGYSNISGLQKDSNGIWRGQATRGGTTYAVALDFQGNVVTN
jgi:hypothetical protein